MKSAVHSTLKTNTLKRILSFTGRHAWFLVLGLVFAIINIAMTLYAPVLIGDAVDNIIGVGNVNFDNILAIIFKLAIVIIIAAAAQWLMNLCTNRVSYHTVKDIREKAFSRMMRVPLSAVDSMQHGELISRMTTDVEQISDGLIMGFTQLFSGVVTIIGTLAFMFSINARIAVVVVVVTPLSLFVASFVAKHTFEMFKTQSAARGEMTSLVEEMIGNAKLVKALCYEQESGERFDVINQELKVCGTKATFYSSITNPATRFVNGVVYACVGILGAIMAVRGVLSVGSLTCFLSYANQYTKPFNEISGVVTELQSAFASAQRVFELLDMEELRPDSDDAVVLEKVDGTVDIENVYFSYRRDVKLIENFNLHVDSGQRIAIVGPTGCGKTTMINLLMRFYDTDSGEIRVSGYPIKKLTRDSLRASYGMVLQETWLKSGTIFENIAYGKKDASHEEVIAAARAARADSFIRRLPKGYDTVVSDTGESISQGQKQLICIARVMLCLPPMLILDEATSSIDSRTEIKIQQAFSEMMQGRTSFIVAHRLSTIKEADCILVMDAGHIIEQGTHDELISRGGFYKNLYYSQYALSETV